MPIVFEDFSPSSSFVAGDESSCSLSDQIDLVFSFEEDVESVEDSDGFSDPMAGLTCEVG